jgi:HAD superfamily hydrolase (TIGR01549 family)
MLKLVIFDLDGTLVDSRAVYAKATELTFPERPPNDFLPFGLAIGRSIELSGVSNSPINLLTTQELETWLHYWYEQQELLTKPFPDTQLILEILLQNKLLLAIITNRPQTRGKIEQLLQKHKLMSYFTNRHSTIVTAGDLGKKKPDPAGIFRICGSLAVAKEETIIIGDSVVDLQAGQNAGIKAIGVSTGVFSLEDLQQICPFAVASSLSEALEIIQREFL